MKERPVIMTGESVRAILAGAKTQTRRVVKLPPQPDHLGRWESTTTGGVGCHLANGAAVPSTTAIWHTRTGLTIASPYDIGDRLWVKETWCPASREHHSVAAYPADGRPRDADSFWAWYAASDDVDEPRWSSPLFMPRWASRLTLEVTEVRVQRVQEISNDDAQAEGVEPYTPPHGPISPEQRVPGPGFDCCRLGDQPHRLPFAHRWDEINGKRRRREPLEIGDPGYTVDRPYRSVVDESASWNSNPWVWAITFRRVA